MPPTANRIRPFAEVVLAVLLRSFKVHPSSKPICWNIAGVSYPTVGNEAKEQSMPVRLEPLSNKA